MKSKICDISGSWLRQITIDEKRYWDIDSDEPFRQINSLTDVAPSDWRYREDLLWLKYNYMRIAS